MTVLAALLAAGEGARFRASGGDSHKLLTPLRGRPLAAWALDAVLAAGFDDVVVVIGADPLDDLLRSARARVVRNPHWAQGIATSLAAAVDDARVGGHDALVVGLADQPGVPPAAWRAVAGAPTEPPIAVATYQGTRGNPVRLDQAIWDLLPRTGDDGARSLIRRRPALVREVPCAGEPFDVDRLEDLHRWS